MGAVMERPADVGQMAQRILDHQRIYTEQSQAMSELFRRVMDGAALFGVDPSEAHEAVRTGRLVETHEICVWLLDINLVDRLTGGKC